MSSSRILLALSVVEIAALLAVLAFFLVVLSRKLCDVADNLHRFNRSVQSIEGHLTVLATIPMVYETLDEIAGALPVVARAANAKAGRR